MAVSVIAQNLYYYQNISIRCTNSIYVLSDEKNTLTLSKELILKYLKEIGIVDITQGNHIDISQIQQNGNIFTVELVLNNYNNAKITLSTKKIRGTTHVLIHDNKTNEISIVKESEIKEILILPTVANVKYEQIIKYERPIILDDVISLIEEIHDILRVKSTRHSMFTMALMIINLEDYKLAIEEYVLSLENITMTKNVRKIVQEECKSCLKLIEYTLDQIKALLHNRRIQINKKTYTEIYDSYDYANKYSVHNKANIIYCDKKSIRTDNETLLEIVGTVIGLSGVPLLFAFTLKGFWFGMGLLATAITIGLAIYGIKILRIKKMFTGIINEQDLAKTVLNLVISIRPVSKNFGIVRDIGKISISNYGYEGAMLLADIVHLGESINRYVLDKGNLDINKYIENQMKDIQQKYIKLTERN